MKRGLQVDFSMVVKVNRLREFRDALDIIAQDSVLVGVPEEKADRRAEALKSGEQVKMNNATLAYIHDTGSPAANIPQREFMRPGITDAKRPITDLLRKVGEKALEGDKQAVERTLHEVGLIAASAVKRRITTGPFQPLKPGTVRARARRGRNVEEVRPLIDTGQMRNSITYVIRRNK